MSNTKKLSPAQAAFLENLKRFGESSPPWGQSGSGRDASAWHRTARSLEGRGLVAVLRSGRGYKAVLADAALTRGRAVSTYRGRRRPGGAVFVTVDGRALARVSRLFNHSSSFEWGYGGSGPAQLALAILAHHLGVNGHDLAVKLHHAFKRTVVATLPREEWSMTSEYVEASVRRLAANATRVES